MDLETRKGGLDCSSTTTNFQSAASGHRRPGAGRPLLRGGPGRAADLEGTRGGQRLCTWLATACPGSRSYLTGQVACQLFSVHAEGERGDSDGGRWPAWRWTWCRQRRPRRNSSAGLSGGRGWSRHAGRGGASPAEPPAPGTSPLDSRVTACSRRLSKEG